MEAIFATHLDLTYMLLSHGMKSVKNREKRDKAKRD
jgi:hypothetical protein